MQKPGWLSKSWLNKHKWSIAGGSVLVAGMIGIIALLYQWSGSGFGPDSTKSIERNPTGQITKTIEVEQSGKTLWDWLSVLGVPFSLTVLGIIFQQREQKRSNQQAELEKNRAEEQAKLEKEIAAANQREEALQAYFDRLSTLLVDKNLIAVAAKVKKASETEGAQQDAAIDEQKELLDAAVDVIRARTLSILRRFEVDKGRKTSVIQFLLEAEAISKLNLNLSGADLSNINLSSTDFSEANLSGANLRGTNLSDTNLSSADLTRINLVGANLMGAKFNGTVLVAAKLIDASLIATEFNGADLNGADLSGADLSGADLSDANLMGTNSSNADLSGTLLISAKLNSATLYSANLNGAVFVDADLSSAKLSGADLSGANFRNARLMRTNFANAQNWTEEQLSSAKLCKTKLPEGCNLDPDRDCQELESRVKGNGRSIMSTDYP